MINGPVIELCMCTYDLLVFTISEKKIKCIYRYIHVIDLKNEFNTLLQASTMQYTHYCMT